MIIGVWGDSITYGSCDSEAFGWVGRLRKSLPIDDNHQLYNFGVCGETSRDVLKRFSIEADAIEPDIVIIAVGLNDTKHQGESTINLLSPEQYVANLKELVTQAKKCTSKIYFVGLTKVDEVWRSEKGSRFFNEDIRKYDELNMRTAKEFGISHIAVFEVLNPDTDLTDGLHPNAGGYEKLFKVIQTCLQLE